MTYTVEIAFDAQRGPFREKRRRVERMLELYGEVVSRETADYAGEDHTSRIISGLSVQNSPMKTWLLSMHFLQR